MFESGAHRTRGASHVARSPSAALPPAPSAMLRWLVSRAEGGHASSARALGFAQESGLAAGSGPDYASAARWYDRAAEGGDEDARVDACYCYLALATAHGGATPEERLRLLSEATMRAMVAASAGNPRAEHILRELGARGEGPQARWGALVEVARGAWEAAHGAEPARVFSTRDEGGTVRPVLNGADGKRYASLGWVGRRCAEFRGTARVVPRHQAVRELMEEEAAWVASQQI